MPLESKFSLADVAAETFPEADTLDWTVPRCTVAVRAVVVDAAEDEP